MDQVLSILGHLFPFHHKSTLLHMGAVNTTPLAGADPISFLKNDLPNLVVEKQLGSGKFTKTFR